MLLDTTYAQRAPFSGTAVYLQQLQRAFADSGEVEIAEAANPQRRPPAGGGFGSVRNLLVDARWTSLELPRKARAQHAAVIHHPLPAVAPRAAVPQVITVLDLAFERIPEMFARGYRTFAHHAHRAAARRAAVVICISETTAADVRSLWGISEERIVVAPLGPGQQLEPQSAPAGPRHFLYVGDAEPRKNLALLLEAYALYRAGTEHPIDLVLAGSTDGAGPGVLIERRPPRDRLAELYGSAAALVHPSLYEGFGLTPLEAMCAGTPVLAARAPGVTEVCGDAAVYADPHDPDAFARAMGELAGDAALRAELRERGKRRAAAFSWAQCARRHAYAYSLAVGK